MRRGPLGAIIFGLALLMQLLVPAMAAQGHVGSHSVVCVDAGSSDSADGSSSGRAPHHEHCGLCQIVCSPVGLLEFLSAWISLGSPTESRVAAWTLELERKARFGFDQHEVPRGPPSLA